MACGVPVVAPDDAVRREVIGEAGVLCDVTYPDAYVRALRTALAHRVEPAARQRAESFPIAATVKAYADLFATLAAGRTGAHH